MFMPFKGPERVQQQTKISRNQQKTASNSGKNKVYTTTVTTETVLFFFSGRCEASMVYTVSRRMVYTLLISFPRQMGVYTIVFFAL